MNDHGDKTRKPDRTGNRTVDVARRRVLQTLAGGAALTGASSAWARDGRTWWEKVLDIPNPQSTSHAREQGQERRPRELNDLRTSKTPWLSDVMLANMDDAIDRFERIAQRRDWPRIPNGRLLRRDDYDERIPRVRLRLALSGELSEKAWRHYRDSYYYDAHLERAVRRFQRGHGLRETGFINRSTRAQLNVSAKERAQQLRMNRRRIEGLMSNRLGDRYVLVNAAAFQLEAVEKYEVTLRHRTIVGKPDRQTPEIRADIRGLNFFPYWRVPMSIATRDLFPRLTKDLSYLEENRIRVLKGHYQGDEIDPSAINWMTADARRIKFRQDPGPWNALGLVRINMPNPEIVYLHDTPMKDLFGALDRSFSAGCVRVQDVMELCGWIAQYEPGWERPAQRIEAILEAGEPVDLKLTRPVPVQFTYITAWAERDGSVHFRPDVYGRDGVEALRGEGDPDAFRPPETLSP